MSISVLPPAIGNVLRQPADADAVRTRHLAVVDLLIACDDLEQRGLARPVRADQTDPITVAESQADRVEDQAISEGQRRVVEHYGARGGGWIARLALAASAARDH